MKVMVTLSEHQLALTELVLIGANGGVVEIKQAGGQVEVALTEGGGQLALALGFDPVADDTLYMVLAAYAEDMADGWSMYAKELRDEMQRRRLASSHSVS